MVIFDEASQITTWDAIGAIARGRQTIIVGDPKQLPPTNFFGRVENDEDNEEIEDHEKDLESILDEAQASGLPTLQLNWHYRSRHESLISFSNWHYYGNQLVTFPAAESLDRGVVFRYLPDAVYDRGKTRQQVLENLGWKIIRIWSPDWWYDTAAALQSVDEQLQQLLENDRLPADDTSANSTFANSTSADQATATLTVADSAAAFDIVAPRTGSQTEAVSNQRDAAAKRGKDAQILFRRVRLPADVDPQTRFYESDYSDQLRTIIRDLLEQQAPIRDDVLIRQVARAHGFARTGATIRKRILDLLDEVPVSEESTGRFFWTAAGPEAVVPFRQPPSAEHRRSLDEISLAELRGLIQSNPRLLQADDPVAAVAKHIGVGRLNRSARDRIDEAINGSR